MDFGTDEIRSIRSSVLRSNPLKKIYNLQLS